MTDLLLAGDYTTALLRFDEVLAKGFSAQTFMSGLNQHMRDLLLAKGPAISLIELTGTLLDRYRQQASQCDTEFLFGAISLLTEADGKIKQSSNQRLLVELGLMKIAGLGKKKNDGSPLDEDYPLPELPSQIIMPQAQPAPVVPQPTTVATTATVVEQPKPEPKPQPTHRAEPAQPTEVISAEPATTSPAPAEPTPAEPQRTVSSRSSTLTRMSIASLMNESRVHDTPTEEQTKEQEQEQPAFYDPKSEEKLCSKREEIIKTILKERPRFVVAFEKMQVKGYTIHLEVPTQALYEEIMRSKTEILLLAARTAEVSGALELDIRINEQVTIERPIKLEDRIKHMTEKNQHLLELKKVLDMEYE
jgi:DNA polymerase-3 subunit gamma/tau